MAKVEKGSFSVDTTGESDLIVLEDDTLTPDFFWFSISARPGTTETHVISSDGWQDMNLDRKVSKSSYADSTVRGTKRSTTQSITHYKNVSSAFTQIIGAYISYTETGGFKYTANHADSNYVVDFMVMEL
jgi:hypothetical protein